MRPSARWSLKRTQVVAEEAEAAAICDSSLDFSGDDLFPEHLKLQVNGVRLGIVWGAQPNSGLKSNEIQF